MSTVKYKVEHEYIYGWDDAGWSKVIPGTYECEPWLFDTADEAQAEIDQMIKDVHDAVLAGDMDEDYDPECYRVVPVEV